MFSFILPIAYKTIYFLSFSLGGVLCTVSAACVCTVHSFSLWFLKWRIGVHIVCLLHNKIPRFCIRCKSSLQTHNKDSWSNGMLHFNMLFMTTKRMSSVIVISIALWMIFSFLLYSFSFLSNNTTFFFYLGKLFFYSLPGHKQKKIINKAQAYACNCSTRINWARTSCSRRSESLL